MRVVAVFSALLLGSLSFPASAEQKDDAIIIGTCEAASRLCHETCNLKYPGGLDDSNLNDILGNTACGGQCDLNYKQCVAPVEGMTLQTMPQSSRDGTVLDPGPRQPNTRRPQEGAPAGGGMRR